MMLFLLAGLAIAENDNAEAAILVIVVVLYWLLPIYSNSLMWRTPKVS